MQQCGRVGASHPADLGFGEALGEEGVGVGLQPRRGSGVDRLAEVGPQGHAIGADRCDGGDHVGHRTGRQSADAGHRAQLDPRAGRRELGALGRAQVGAGQLLGRVGDEHRAARRELAHDREVLGRADVARGEDRVVLGDEVEHRPRLGEQLTVVVGHHDAGPGDAELAGDAVHDVLSARQGGKPDHPCTQSQRHLHRRGVDSAHLPVAADAADHAQTLDLLADRPRERRGGEGMRLEHDGRMTGRGGVGGRFDRVDRPGAVRVGPEVAVQIGGTREIDAHVDIVARMAIHYEQSSGHVVLITIDRPEARNAADMEHFKLLREAWDRFRDDDEAWVAIVTGVGDAFFSGADLKRYVPEITKLQRQISEQGLTEIDGYRLDDGVKAVLRNYELHKPVIAAVNGFCTAGGMEMLGGTDIRLACPEAQFAVMEPKRGLFAGGGTTVRLPRQIPWAVAMEFLLCADLIPASRAYEMGLLNAVVPGDELLDAARGYAARIVANAPLAVQATKQSALGGLYHDEEEVKVLRRTVRGLRDVLVAIDPDDPQTARVAIDAAVALVEWAGRGLRSAFEQEAKLSSRIFSTEDAREGPLAFAEKRPPVWKAR